MNERTLNRRRVFEGRLLKVDVVDVELDSGKRSVREVVCHPGAAVILARHPDGRFVFVRQYRKAAEQVLLEVVAGTLSPGEDPDACAARELREETGYAAAEMRKLGVAYPCPGYSEELLHFYYARLEPQAGACAPDEDEHLETVLLTAAEIERLIAAGALRDAKSLAAWTLYRSHGAAP